MATTRTLINRWQLIHEEDATCDAASDYLSRAIDVTEFDELQMEIDLTAINDGAVSDTMNAELQYEEEGQAVNLYVEQYGYMIYELDDTGILTAGTRELQLFDSKTGVTANLPWRERLGFTHPPKSVKLSVYFAPGAGPDTSIFSFTVRLYGHRRR